jgi:hypothetical protein
MLLYGFTVSGASVHIHYCMDEFSNFAISLSGKKSEQCGFCGMEEKDNSGCCTEQIQKAETEKDQLQKSVQLSFKTPVILQKQEKHIRVFSLYHPGWKNLLFSNALPGRIPLNVLHCTFLI